MGVPETGSSTEADWEAHFRRECSRYQDGESRLPAAEDADKRQRQLMRLGNAADGAGLALLMQARSDEAGEWFRRAAARYRESFADAPPNSWGRPIGAIKALVLAGDWAGAEEAARWALEVGAEFRIHFGLQTRRAAEPVVRMFGSNMRQRRRKAPIPGRNAFVGRRCLMFR